MNKLLILALCGFAFLCISCGDDGDPPVITFSSPADNTTLSEGDILSIEVVVTDDIDIASIVIGSEGFFTADPIEGLGGADDRSFTVTSELTITDVVQKGDYEVTATATDNDGNSATESISVTIE